jgi:hypothetical protein
MKTEKQLPQLGRPIVAPSDADLVNFGPFQLTVNDTVKILRECGAPAFAGAKLTPDERAARIAANRPLPRHRSWGRVEALLILQCLHAPLLLAKDSVALAFARLFAESPSTMIAALPKIKSLLKRRAKSPKQAVILDYALRRYETFWSKDARLLADDLQKSLNLPVTFRVVEHARADLRKHLKAFPQTRRNFGG